MEVRVQLHGADVEVIGQGGERPPVGLDDVALDATEMVRRERNGHGDLAYSQAEAQGRIRAEEAGFTPLPARGVDKPSTHGHKRPGPKAA